MPCDAMRLRRCHAVKNRHRLHAGYSPAVPPMPPPLPSRRGLHPSPVTRHPSPVTRHPSPVTRHAHAHAHAHAFPGILPILPRFPLPVRESLASCFSPARWQCEDTDTDTDTEKGRGSRPSPPHCWRSGHSPQAIAAAFFLATPCAKNPTITDLERTAQSPQEAQVTPS